LELGLLPGITFDVLPELGIPERAARPWSRGVAAAGMTVPETAMHEHHGLMPGQHDVGRARQVPSMQPEAVAQSMEQAADSPLRDCVAAAYSRHVAAALMGNGRLLARIFSHPGRAAAGNSAATISAADPIRRHLPSILVVEHSLTVPGTVRLLLVQQQSLIAAM
jgi:hypothetical protein